MPRNELIKIFIKNKSCSALIGTKGQNIKKFQEQAKVTIIMNKYGEFYPGTNDRIMAIKSNESDESEDQALRRIFSAAVCVFDQQVGGFGENTQSDMNFEMFEFSGEEEDASTTKDINVVTFKIILPNNIIGKILGRKAKHLNDIKKKTSTDIKISEQNFKENKKQSPCNAGPQACLSNKSNFYGPLNERVVIFKGTKYNLKKSFILFLTRLKNISIDVPGLFNYDFKFINYDVYIEKNLIPNSEYDKNMPYVEAGYYLKLYNIWHVSSRLANQQMNFYGNLRISNLPWDCIAELG